MAEGLGRVIVPDNIGMGDSDKLMDSGADSYTFADLRRYLGALLEQLDVRDDVVLVIHDWGSALGFDWANHLVIQNNAFVEQVLPASTLHGLSDEVLSVCRKPYLDPGESRRPTLTLPRQLPIDGEPADAYYAVADYSEWMTTNDIPKLMVNADPGLLLNGRLEQLARAWRNQKDITVPGSHFVQEDSGEEIGRALAEWLPTIG